jgi:dual specificity tyrosine-phosphorylation-regulated kinase 2/3/4
MLRGSTSKRHLSQQLETQPENTELAQVKAELPEKAATTGWKGRHRGNVSHVTRRRRLC